MVFMKNPNFKTSFSLLFSLNEAKNESSTSYILVLCLLVNFLPTWVFGQQPLLEVVTNTTINTLPNNFVIRVTIIDALQNFKIGTKMIKKVPCSSGFQLSNTNANTIATGNNKETVTAYPNPVTNDLILDEIQEGTELSIIDANGQIVKSNIKTGSTEYQYSIDCKDLPSGIYLIFLKNNQFTQKFKFTKL